MSLASKDVLKPLHRLPKRDPEAQTARVREFVSLLVQYKAENIGSSDAGAGLTLILNEAQTLLRNAGIVSPRQVIDEELERVGFYSIVRAPSDLGVDDTAERQARIEELLPAIKPVLDDPDPLRLAVADIQACGYAGDTTAAETTYIVVTTRLLPIQQGQMPAHEAHVAASGEGKTYTTQRVLAELPSCAYVVVNPGSPRAFIYGEESLKHKVLFFPEIDALPEGEDHPLGTAIRTLLQDGSCSYDVVEKDPTTNRQTVRKIVREGPTTLATTATRSLDGKQSSQMDTRLFTISLLETTEQHAAALVAVAELANEIEPRTPDPALVGFQEYLQLLAPWHVFIPYGVTLAKLLRPAAGMGRIMRDFARLISLIKAVAILRHAHRDRTPGGAVIATLEDYETVRRLLEKVFVGSATGAPEELRMVVTAVREAKEYVTVPDLTRILEGKLSQPSIRRHVIQALKQGWLKNAGMTKEWELSAANAEELPTWAGLPTVEDLARATTSSQTAAQGSPLAVARGARRPPEGEAE